MRHAAHNPHRVHHSPSGLGTAQHIAQLNALVNSLANQVAVIGAGSIGPADVGQIDGTTNIIANSITASGAGFGSLSAGAINSYTIATGAISAYIIAGNSITLASSLGSTPKVLLDNTGIKMYDGAGIQQNTFDAATGSMTVNKGTITGAVVQTGGSATGTAGSNKVMMDSTGIKAFDSVGSTTVQIDTATGSLTVSKGTITGATVQTSGSSTGKVILDGTGVKAIDSLGNTTVQIDTTGALTVAKGSITLSSTIPAGTGARISIDSTGIKAYNASNQNLFSVDGTTGLVTATGVITAQPGSAVPTGVITGSLPGSANRYSNSTFQNGAGVYDFTGWSTDGTCTPSNGGVVAPPVYGALTAKIVTVVSNPYIYFNDITNTYRRVLPGLNYTFSHYVYPTTAARQSAVNVQWFDSTGTSLGTTTGTFQNTTLNAWTRITTTALAPAGAAYARGVHYPALSAAAGEVLYVDAFQMEMGDRVSAWAPRPDEILYAQINAVNINVSQLSAISADLGNITAGTITSATFKTNSTVGVSNAAGVILDAAGLRAYDGTVNTLDVNASGAVTMTGLVHALGVDMPGAGATSPPPQANAIIWKNSAGGVTAFMTGGPWTPGSTSEVKMSACYPAGMNNEIAYVSAFTGLSNQGSVTAVASSGPPAATWVAHIIDGFGVSSFLQHGSATGPQKSASGTGTFTWSGASQFDGPAAIVPWPSPTIAGVIFTCGRTTAGNPVLGYAINFGTSFQGGGWCFAGIPAAGQVTGYSWVAWGT